MGVFLTNFVRYGGSMTAVVAVLTVLGALLHGPRERLAEARTRRSGPAAPAHRHDTPRHRARMHHRRYPMCSTGSGRW